ncbi:mechanosensory protein 2 [Trichuris trichiura]|uniref:Mechanosensory protein 2 n=1 Tax=Trichuris trichiura TaxID=36087 RepID=A0A077Z1G4_TRITR|nr:mechanosensory protein 2 [Trichuris trichiura]
MSDRRQRKQEYESEPCSFAHFQVVKEYERAVIFRLGRLLPGGARGPGIFFVNPCTDTYRKVDLRVVSFDVPPQETSLDEATDPWGVKVERVEVKDVRLPVQLQRAMAAEAEATREARAKAIAADGEQRASKALKEAADIIIQSPAALQLRYLQTLTTISAERNSTIIFPFPVDLLSYLLEGKKAAGSRSVKPSSNASMAAAYSSAPPTSPTTTYFSTASTFSAPVTHSHSQAAVSPSTSPGLSL